MGFSQPHFDYFSIISPIDGNSGLISQWMQSKEIKRLKKNVIVIFKSK